MSSARAEKSAVQVKGLVLALLAIGALVGFTFVRPWLGVAPTVLAAACVMTLCLLMRAWRSKAAVSTDTVILVGDGPLVSAYAELLAGGPTARSASPFPGFRSARVVRAASKADVEKLLSQIRGTRYVVVEQLTSASDYSDYRGGGDQTRTVLLSAIDMVTTSLERVPQSLVRHDSRLVNIDRVYKLRPSYAIAKRAIDVAFALFVGFLILPLVPLIAVLIKVDSSGPAFFKQRRVGLAGQVFWMVKFRTMRVDAARWNYFGTQVGDPRITRVGRWLRGTRLDEIPQLVNVLRGEMSLVGPRPIRFDIAQECEAKLPHFALRYCVKPGLTGWAQVRHDYAGTLEEQRVKLEYDLFYIRNMKLLLDLRILLLTSLVILGRRGR